MIRWSVPILLGILLSGCAYEITSPEARLEGLPEGLRVEFTVAPEAVPQRAPFSVHLSVTNTTAQPIELVTAHGCLVVPHVRRDGVRLPFHGSSWGCTTAITTHTFAPGETKSLSWGMRAELYAEKPGDVEGAPAPKGTYRVQAEFETGTGAVVERTLRVR